MNWNLYNFTAPRDQIAKRLSETTLPQPVRDFIASQAAGLPAKIANLDVNAFCQEVTNPRLPGRMMLNIQVTINGS